MGLLSRRRDFLKSGAAAGTILSLTPAMYRSVFASETPPSERVRIGSIGVGLQGTLNIKKFSGQPTASIVAVCDVDTKHLAAAGGEVVKAGGKAPATFADYRKLLDDKSIDAVCITTPDHWHALQTIDACQAGKDVYVEKPLSLTISEGRAMVDAATKYKRVVQTGSMQRSSNEFRTACELVRSGAVGKVHTVKVGLPKPNFKGMAVKDSAPPPELDYNNWIGPAPMKPYNEKHVHYLFRFYWDYSGGQQTNFGAHHYDIAQWGLGMDETGPVAVSGKAKFHPEMWYETPDWTEIVYTYANGIKMIGGQDQRAGTEFIGDKGSVYVTRGKMIVTPDELKKTTITVPLAKSTSHHLDFLECMKSRKTPIADVAIGHRSATVCHLGNIAIRTGKAITWNPETEQIVADPEAAKMLSKEYRKPWTIG